MLWGVKFKKIIIIKCGKNKTNLKIFLVNAENVSGKDYSNQILLETLKFYFSGCIQRLSFPISEGQMIHPKDQSNKVKKEKKIYIYNLN